MYAPYGARYSDREASGVFAVQADDVCTLWCSVLTLRDSQLRPTHLYMHLWRSVL